MQFELLKLPYSVNSLEPYISKRTLEIHYGKHFNSYLTNLTNLVQGTKFVNLEIETIIKVAEGNLLQ